MTDSLRAGRNFETLDSIEWIARMSDYVPDPGQHRTIFYGEYINRTRGAAPRALWLALFEICPLPGVEAVRKDRSVGSERMPKRLRSGGPSLLPPGGAPSCRPT